MIFSPVIEYALDLRQHQVSYKFLRAHVSQFSLSSLLLGVVVRIHDKFEPTTSHPPRLGLLASLDEVTYRISFS